MDEPLKVDDCVIIPSVAALGSFTSDQTSQHQTSQETKEHGPSRPHAASPNLMAEIQTQRALLESQLESQFEEIESQKRLLTTVRAQHEVEAACVDAERAKLEIVRDAEHAEIEAEKREKETWCRSFEWGLFITAGNAVALHELGCIRAGGHVGSHAALRSR